MVDALLELRRPPVDRLIIHARTDWSAYYAMAVIDLADTLSALKLVADRR